MLPEENDSQENGEEQPLGANDIPDVNNTEAVNSKPKSESDGGNDNANAASPAPQPATDEDISSITGCRVLVVEDTKPMRMLLAKTLSRAGVQVDEAVDGRYGLEKLREAFAKKKPYDLIVSDLMMPVLDGYKMLQHIRADPDLEKTPIIIVTTRSERESLVRCAKYGISSYVLKPFKTALLLKAVEKAIAASGGGRNKGLTRQQVRELRTLLKNAAQNALDGGLSTAPNIDEEPISSAALKFLDDICPEE